MAPREDDSRLPSAQSTLYDAVAGRVSKDGFLQTGRADLATRSEAVVPPEEALFRRRAAPIRYQEDDEYFQDRFLRADQKLPDSDLLKIIHAYAADYYARTTSDGGKVSQKSLDETALLAMGILLEEAVAELIGKTGHLALMEDAT